MKHSGDEDGLQSHRFGVQIRVSAKKSNKKIGGGGLGLGIGLGIGIGGSIGLGIGIEGSIGLGIGIGLGVVVSVLLFLRNTSPSLPPKKVVKSPS